MNQQLTMKWFQFQSRQVKVKLNNREPCLDSMVKKDSKECKATQVTNRLPGLRVVLLVTSIEVVLQMRS